MFAWRRFIRHCAYVMRCCTVPCRHATGCMQRGEQEASPQDACRTDRSDSDGQAGRCWPRNSVPVSSSYTTTRTCHNYCAYVTCARFFDGENSLRLNWENFPLGMHLASRSRTHVPELRPFAVIKLAVVLVCVCMYLFGGKDGRGRVFKSGMTAKAPFSLCRVYWLASAY